MIFRPSMKKLWSPFIIHRNIKRTLLLRREVK